MRCRISRTPEHIAQLGISKPVYYTDLTPECKSCCCFYVQILPNKKESGGSLFYRENYAFLRYR